MLVNIENSNSRYSSKLIHIFIYYWFKIYYRYIKKLRIDVITL